LFRFLGHNMFDNLMVYKEVLLLLTQDMSSSFGMETKQREKSYGSLKLRQHNERETKISPIIPEQSSSAHVSSFTNTMHSLLHRMKAYSS
jgi:hypothetical protein